MRIGEGCTEQGKGKGKEQASTLLQVTTGSASQLEHVRGNCPPPNLVHGFSAEPVQRGEPLLADCQGVATARQQRPHRFGLAHLRNNKNTGVNEYKE